MRPLSIGLAAAVLADCNQSPNISEPGGPVGQAPSGPIRTAEQPAGPPANTASPSARHLIGDLPEPDAGPRFVGKWAADMKSCETAAWQFTDTTLRTPAGSSCTFGQVTQVPGGYDIQATCTAEGPPTADTLKIRFAESAKAMLFNSKTIADAGLIFCGRDV